MCREDVLRRDRLSLGGHDACAALAAPAAGSSLPGRSTTAAAANSDALLLPEAPPAGGRGTEAAPPVRRLRLTRCQSLDANGDIAAAPADVAVSQACSDAGNPVPPCTGGDEVSRAVTVLGESELAELNRTIPNSITVDARAFELEVQRMNQMDVSATKFA